MEQTLNQFFEGGFGKLAKKIMTSQSNILAVFLVVILGMLMVPLPPFVLSLCFVINFSLSIGIILVTTYVKKPLEFSTFPTILLFVTLMRLALEISATRSILLDAYAGEVIHSVGEFVVGGNFVVGIIIFIILFVVNFMVVTNGAGRVSEVAARFSLDSMPGKQLAVDADLNAGIIDENEARSRREQIAKESDFYATMDGGSKFVKGDAIASIIIAVINIVAGFIIGIVQLGMDAGEAASTYTLLTIGEGLASQIPALIISVATGIIVTRSEPDLDLATDIGSQLFKRKEVFAVSAGALFLMGIGIHGAFVPFTMIAVPLAYFAYRLYEKEQQVPEGMIMDESGELVSASPDDEIDEQQEKLKKMEQDNSPEGIMKLLKVDQLEIELGYKLVNLIDTHKGGDLMERIGQIRRQIMVDLGLPVPAIRVHDNLQVSSNDYQVKLRGAIISKGSVESDCLLAVNTGLVDMDGGELSGKETVEPSYGLPAIWIDEKERDKAETLGYTVATPSSVLATHLTEIIRSHGGEILSRQDLVRMYEEIKQYNDTIVSEVEDTMGTGDLLAVLKLLLKEQVSIRDLSSIMEVCINYVKVNKDPEFLAERVRETIGRQICSEYLSDNKLHATTFHPSVEEEIVNSLHMGRIALEPIKTKALIEKLSASFEAMSDQGFPPVLLCSSKIRSPMRKVIERSLPQMVVISYSEVPNTIEAQSISMVSWD